MAILEYDPNDNSLTKLFIGFLLVAALLLGLAAYFGPIAKDKQTGACSETCEEE